MRLQIEQIGNRKHNQYVNNLQNKCIGRYSLSREQYTNALEKEWNNFPNTWGGVNALTKKVVKDLLVMINLPYSKELAGFIRYIVEYPNTIRYSEYKRSLIGKTVEDVIFEQ